MAGRSKMSNAADCSGIIQVGYAFNFFYNLTFPPSRIALVLLYKRVFWVKKWFAYLCWFLISCYAGYSISTVVTCAVGTLPVEANWNKSIKPTHVIDFRKLQLANCSFNIATDIILLVMPLMVIWTLQMTKAHRAGISAVFCLGVLTVIASIMRCYYTFNASRYDPLCMCSPNISNCWCHRSMRLTQYICSRSRLHGFLDSDGGVPRHPMPLLGHLGSGRVGQVSSTRYSLVTIHCEHERTASDHLFRICV